MNANDETELGAIAATALYDYAANESDETSLLEGEDLIVLRRPNDDWWYGVTTSGEGFFPAQYVEISDMTATKEDQTMAEKVLKEATSEVVPRAQDVEETFMHKDNNQITPISTTMRKSSRSHRRAPSERNTGSLEILLLDKKDLNELAKSKDNIPCAERKSSKGMPNPQSEKLPKKDDVNQIKQVSKRISYLQNPKEDLVRMLEAGEQTKSLMDNLRTDSNFFDLWVQNRNHVIKSTSLGEIFTKHKNRRGQQRFILVLRTSKGYILHWSKSKDRAKVQNYQGSMPVSEIRGIIPGVSSIHFRRTARKDCSFSIVGRARTVDIECDNPGMCQKWKKIFQDLIKISMVADSFIQKCRALHNQHPSQDNTSEMKALDSKQLSEPKNLASSSSIPDELPPPPPFRASLFEKFAIEDIERSSNGSTSELDSNATGSPKPSTPLPEGWVSGFDEEGNIYYYDSLNERSTWSKPSRAANVLPTGWSTHESNSGEVYYYHEASRRSTWTMPKYTENDESVLSLKHAQLSQSGEFPSEGRAGKQESHTNDDTTSLEGKEKEQSSFNSVKRENPNSFKPDLNTPKQQVRHRVRKGFKRPTMSIKAKALPPLNTNPKLSLQDTSKSTTSEIPVSKTQNVKRIGKTESERKLVTKRSTIDVKLLSRRKARMRNRY